MSEFDKNNNFSNNENEQNKMNNELNHQPQNYNSNIQFQNFNNNDQNNLNNQNKINTNINSHNDSRFYGNIQDGYFRAENHEYQRNFYNQNAINNDNQVIQSQNPKQYEDSPISIVNINDQKDKNKGGSKFKKRLFAGLAATAIFGVSVGVGIGIGSDASEVLFPEKSETVGFKFEDIPEAVTLSAADNNIVQLVKDVGNSIVNISMTVKQTDLFFNQVYESAGAGSGIIFKQDDEKVYIVTNNHVVDGANTVSISITGTEKIPAKLVGKDAQSDLAVISIQKSDLRASGINEVKEAVFGNSDEVEVGEYVLAIGNALGQGKTVTQGIISAQNKDVNIDGKNLTVLQTDAAINPGNSGGALIDIDGKVIGINTAKTSSSAIEGTGYAIPSSTAKTIAEELIQNGTASRPYLGVVGFTITDDFKNMYNINVSGVFIKAVEQNSAAASAGIKSTDIITSINGQNITSMEELASAISKCKVGDKINLGVVRNGYQQMSVDAVLLDMNQQF